MGLAGLIGPTTPMMPTSWFMPTPMLHRLRGKGVRASGRHNPAAWAEPPSPAPREEERVSYAETRIVAARMDRQFPW
jgi:hypothetical protein